MEKPVRLDKFLADAGAGTRSEVKKYIQKGQVQVNGKSSFPGFDCHYLYAENNRRRSGGYERAGDPCCTGICILSF